MAKNTKFQRSNSLCRLTLISAQILLGASSAGICGELQDIEQIIFSVDKIITSRDLLVKLDLLDEWTKAEEEDIVIDKSGELGATTYTYKAKGYRSITAVSLTWEDSQTTSDGLNDLVVKIEVVDDSFYYVYVWRENGYVQIGTHKKQSRIDAKEPETKVDDQKERTSQPNRRKPN